MCTVTLKLLFIQKWVNSGMVSPSTLMTLVINLDRSPARLAKVAAQLDPLGWAWERLPASDGRQLTLADPQLIDVPAFERLHGKPPLPGELGCYLSHVRAMQRFLASDQPYLLILEDDVQLGPDLPRVVQALLAKADEWDVVMLSGIHSASPLLLGEICDRFRLAVPLSRYAGSSCYLLSRRAAQRYLQDLLPMRLPYDHEYDRAWARGLRTRIVVPAPCIHSFVDGSEVHPPGVKRHNRRWYQRWHTYAYRLRTDVHRVLHGLAQWWRHRP